MKRQSFAVIPTGLLLFLLITLAACGGSSMATNSGDTPSGSDRNAPASNANSNGNVVPGSGVGIASTARFLYAIENPGGPSIVEPFIITRTGVLTRVEPTVSVGDNANDIAADPLSKFIFVGNSSGCCTAPPRAPQLISYTIGRMGALTFADQENLPNENADTLAGLLIDPTGSDLYASWQQVQIEGSISSFGIDRGTGHMNLLGPDPLNTIMPGRMAITPDGKFVYASIQQRHGRPDLGGFDLFLRDPATGLLTDTGRQFPGSRVGVDFYTDPVIALNGQYLLAVVDSTKITVWAIDSTTGDLTIASELQGNFKGLTVDAGGTWAITSLGDGSVASYRVNTDGSLTAGGNAMAAPGVTNVVIDSIGNFVYAENSTAPQIFGFSFDPSMGALTTLPGSPFATAAQPIRMATVPMR